MMYIFFLPKISAILPNGTKKIADASKFEEAIQVSVIASITNSFPIIGRAILIDDAIKVVRNEESVITNNAAPLLTVFLFGSIKILCSEIRCSVNVNDTSRHEFGSFACKE